MKQNNSWKKWKLYAIAGSVYLLIWYFSDLFANPGKPFPLLLNSIWLSVYIVFVNFLFFEELIVVIRKRWIRPVARMLYTSLCNILVLIMLSAGLYVWRWVGVQLSVYMPLRIFPSSLQLIIYLSPQGILSLLFFSLVSHLNNHIRLTHTAQQLRAEKAEAELNFLRSQANPHFLFNTLNNIYSLARDKSDLAPDAILRLSKMLRYMLYETTAYRTTVASEVQLIDDYILLEKLRYDDSLRVNFSYDAADQQTAIPPLLLLPLVENAFKHGVSETGDEPFVEIDLFLRQHQLSFVVKNSASPERPTGIVKENIGLSNLRRQLELLYTQYELLVIDNKETFTVTLQINLLSHV